MDRNMRSVIPPMNHANKPRNGPVSPRGDMNNPSYSNHQPHYNSYNNSSQNHSGSVSSSGSSPNNNQTQHPNSDLINFVSGAWKEKMASEVFKSETTEKLNHFDLDGWLRTRQH